MGIWQLWAMAAAVFAALTAVLAKLGLQGIEANLATLLRTFVVAASLSVLQLVKGQLSWPLLQGLPRSSLTPLLFSGLATAASWLCYFQALQQGPVSRVAPLDKISVVLVALFGVTVLGESLTTRGWAGVLLMTLGAALVAWPD
jgi:bacterial/archaeal transporter family protein